MDSGSNKDKGYTGECIAVVERDRLSELPDEVIVHILSFLPLLDAVRTVLLRRFGYLWTLVPNLAFYDHDIVQGLGQLNTINVLESVPFVDSWLCIFISKVLGLYRRPKIDKFLMDVEKGYSSIIQDAAVEEIGRWVRFALRREAKELILVFSNGKNFAVPAPIFTSQSVVVLHLEHCHIELPSRVYMGSLKRLKLVWAQVDDDSFNKFVSCCPSLQEIVVNNSIDLLVFSFSSPSIEKLELCRDLDEDFFGSYTINCPYLRILNLYVYIDDMDVVNVPSVREVAMGAPFCPGEGEEAHHCRRFLEWFQNAEVFTFTQAFLNLDEALGCWRVNVGFPQTRWNRVVLDSSLQEVHIAGICCLVEKSPCLEELIIHAQRFGDSGRVEMLSNSNFVAPHLKSVCIHGYGRPYEAQLQLAESLLKSAANLEKLVIFFNPISQLTEAEELQFEKQLLNFPRASTKARIEVNGNCKN